MQTCAYTARGVPILRTMRVFRARCAGDEAAQTTSKWGVAALCSSRLARDANCEASSMIPSVAATAEGHSFWRAFALRAQANAAISLLLIVAATLRAFRLGRPEGSLIFDEAYYVQDARVILGLPVMFHHLPGSALSGLDPNSEHPPLAKLIMAAFMWMLGDREIAWRIPSVVLGTLAIWLVYRIALLLEGTRQQALLAAFVVAFDNLFFVHSRIATLDIYVVTFVLLGTWLYLRSWFEVAGLAFGLAVLCKLNGIVGVGAIALYELGFALRQKRRIGRAVLGPLITTAGFCALAAVIGLAALDAYWTEFASPFDHFKHIVVYAKNLTRLGPPQGAESTPLQWWLNAEPIAYLQVMTTTDGVSKREILFSGAMTTYVIFAAPFALTRAAHLGWRESRLGAFAACSFIANYVPFFIAWFVSSRISYIYYMVPSIPAIALAIALVAESLPRSMRWCFVGAVLFSFWFTFPFRVW